jgi:hypothetical protein
MVVSDKLNEWNEWRVIALNEWNEGWLVVKLMNGESRLILFWSRPANC